MDLIYMNKDKEDLGVLLDYKLDIAIGSDENDFQCIVSSINHCCEADYYLYIEGTEYGGLIDSIKINTKTKEVTYSGQSWHGLLDAHILEPNAGDDYLIVSGEANSVINSLLVRMRLNGLFKASNSASGINISNYKMNRYISGYEGIMKMLKTKNAKLQFSFHDGFVYLSAVPIDDYSHDEQFDTDQIDFEIKKNYKPINHVICLGQGDLSEREVIHLFANQNGTISNTQSLFGADEVAYVYDNSNAESTEELEKGGKEIIKESWNSDDIKFTFNSNVETYDVGDIIGALERTTQIEVSANITKKIVKIKDNSTTISYEVGE